MRKVCVCIEIVDRYLRAGFLGQKFKPILFNEKRENCRCFYIFFSYITAQKLKKDQFKMQTWRKTQMSRIIWETEFYRLLRLLSAF